MKFKSLLIALLLTPLSVFACGGENHSEAPVTNKTSDITMSQLLKVHPDIAKLKPTKRLPKDIMGKVLRIGTKPYQMRIAFFETKNPTVAKMTFGEYVKSEKMLEQKARIISSSYGDVIFFSNGETKADDKETTSFMLSLREIEESEVAELDDNMTEFA